MRQKRNIGKNLCVFSARKKTPHTEESLAIHIRNENDKTLVYTADTGFTKDLGTLALGVDLLVMECSFFKNKPVETHLELAEAIYLARYAKPKKVILTHLYPEWDNVDFLKEVEKLSPLCEVIEAKDGSRLEIIGEREQITENNLR
ncbi:MAG: hypothetical protein LC778_02730 [Acidobacteria bacterium]|nr:hypothetical protein [Acidobacteriota bacterium]